MQNKSYLFKNNPSHANLISMGKKESHNGGLGYLFGAERKRDKKGKSLEASPPFFFYLFIYTLTQNSYHNYFYFIFYLYPASN
jgi:hypothetical protein